MGFPGGSTVKYLPAYADARDVGSILGLGRSSGEGKDIHSSILVWRIPSICPVFLSGQRSQVGYSP